MKKPAKDYGHRKEYGISHHINWREIIFVFFFFFKHCNVINLQNVFWKLKCLYLIAYCISVDDQFLGFIVYLFLMSQGYNPSRASIICNSIKSRYQFKISIHPCRLQQGKKNQSISCIFQVIKPSQSVTWKSCPCRGHKGKSRDSWCDQHHT